MLKLWVSKWKFENQQRKMLFIRNLVISCFKWERVIIGRIVRLDVPHMSVGVLGAPVYPKHVRLIEAKGGVRLIYTFLFILYYIFTHQLLGVGR